MKNEEQLCEMYINAKSKFYDAQTEVHKLLNDDNTLAKEMQMAKTNEAFRRTQVRMLEAILEVPEKHTVVDAKPLDI